MELQRNQTLAANSLLQKVVLASNTLNGQPPEIKEMIVQNVARNRPGNVVNLSEANRSFAFITSPFRAKLSQEFAVVTRAQGIPQRIPMARLDEWNACLEKARDLSSDGIKAKVYEKLAEAIPTLNWGKYDAYHALDKATKQLPSQYGNRLTYSLYRAHENI